MGWGKIGPEGLGGLVSDVNSAVENTMRLSTYVTVKNQFIKNGMTESEAIREAADVARNLTVNFTMKGELTPVFNSLYLFFNAGTAGSARALLSYSKSRRVRQMAKAASAFTIANSFANYLLAGDDEEGRNKYAQIPMSQRSRQIYIYVPGSDDFVKIPLAYGFNIPFIIGDTIVALGMGQINPAEAAVHLVGAMMESFFPMDVANSDRFLVQFWKTASPTISDPVIDLMANENWAGNPIFKEPYPGSMAEPPAYRAWSSTSAPSKFISDWMNRLSAGAVHALPGGEKPRLGTKYEKGFMGVEPTIIDYFYDMATGSMGRFIKNSANIGWDLATKGKVVPRHRETGEVAWYRVPILRRFVSDSALSDKWDINDKYNIYKEEIGEAKYFAKGMLADFGTQSDEWKEFRKSSFYKLITLDNYRSKTEGAITKLYKRRAAIRRNRIIREDIKEEQIIAIENRIRDLKRRFISVFEDKLERGIRLKSLRKAA